MKAEHFGIRYPVSSTAEREYVNGDVLLRFSAADGAQMTVVMRERDAVELFTGGLRASRAEVARSLYVDGRIEIDAFEAELSRAMR